MAQGQCRACEPRSDPGHVAPLKRKNWFVYGKPPPERLSKGTRPEAVLAYLAPAGIRTLPESVRPRWVAYPSFVMMIVPEAANIPPTPWQTEILAPGIWAGAMPRIWRTLSCSAYMPYMPECM